ncbi:UNVERIFIED_CONTAM: hypothetical protein HDU68_000385 [Siphonaria sp. JEL0065]|nr:hypothetical protein HDU68_000385 [Siphonaria sp. JEL0065]
MESHLGTTIATALVLTISLAHYFIVPSDKGDLGGLSAAASEEAKLGLQKFYTHPNEHIVALSLGKTYYRLVGPENGKRVVLVHGITATWSTSPHIIEYLVSKGYRVLAYDIYGRGRSDSPGVQYNVSTYNQQLLDLMNHVHWDHACVIGYSMGGSIATHFADAFPEKVDKLVLIAPAGLIQKVPPLASIFRVPVLGNLIYYTLGRGLIVKVVKRTLVPHLHSHHMVKHASGQIVSIQYNPGFARAYRSTVLNGILFGNEPTFTRVGGKFKDRVFCVWGTDDIICNYKTDSPVFKTCMPHAKFLTIERGAHNVVILDCESVKIENIIIVQITRTVTTATATAAIYISYRLIVPSESKPLGTLAKVISCRKTFIARYSNALDLLMAVDECTRTLEGHTDRVTSVAISTDGKTIVSGSWDKTVKLWDTRTAHAHPVNTPGSPFLSLLVIGDWGAQQDIVDEDSVAKAMDSWANKMGSMAVISLGDNYYKGGSYDYEGVESVDDPKFNTLWKNVYAGTTLAKLPWWVVLGNHDWMGLNSFKYELEYQNSQWDLSDFFYTKRVLLPGTTDTYASFIFIETDLLQYGYNPGGKMEKNFELVGWVPESNTADKQLQWIENLLNQANNDAFIFVMGHHGCFSCAKDLEGSKYMPSVCQLINKYQVTAYMHGHHHTLAYYYTNNNATLHVQSGAGGRTDDACAPLESVVGQEKTKTYGFAHLRVYPRFAQFDFVTEAGESVFNAYMGFRQPVTLNVETKLVMEATDPAVHFIRGAK